MSRLIDADKLYKAIISKYDEVEDLIELIDEQPTAYDVDKVVKELRKCISDNDCADKTREDYAYIDGVIDSIHIVESGGIK